MSVRTAPFNEVDYYLNSKEFGRLKLESVIGWEGDLMDTVRAKNKSGMINSVSLNLEFYGNSLYYLKKCKDAFVKPTLTKFIQHPTEIKTVKVYEAILDISEYKLKDGKVKLKAQKVDGSMKLNASKSKQIELESLEALDGTILPPLKKHTLDIAGQDILFESKYEVDDIDNIAEMYNQTNGNTRGATVNVPLKLTERNHENAFSTHPNTSYGDNSHERNAIGRGSNMFFINAIRDLRLDIRFDLTFKFNLLENDDLNWGNFKVIMSKYKDGTGYIHKENDIIYDESDIASINGTTITVNYRKTIDILKGESLALQFHQLMDGKNGHSAHLRIKLDDIVCPMTVSDKTPFGATSSDVVLPYERIERLLQIITGRTDKKLLRTEAFGRKDLGYEKDGEYAYLSSLSGLMVRGFDKSFTTSWLDTMNSFFAIKGISYNFEKINGIETMVVEKLEYFHQNSKTFEFPNEALDVEIEFDTKIQYTYIDVGYEKGGTDYENTQGLNDPNGKRRYSTPFSEKETVLKLLSKDRGDTTGLEITRRKPKSLFPNEDTKGDNDNWIISSSFLNGKLVIKKYNEMYSEPPTGIFSPETFGNLDLTPMRNLKELSWYINSSLKKFRNKKIKYVSSVGNVDLSTKKKGQDAIKEDDDLKINSFNPARFSDTKVKFTHEIDFKLKELIEGHTVIDGRKIPNFYFKWRIKIDGVYANIRLMKVKANGKIEALIIE